jgi:hypothetical protein
MDEESVKALLIAMGKTAALLVGVSVIILVIIPSIFSVI